MKSEFGFISEQMFTGVNPDTTFNACKRKAVINN